MNNITTIYGAPGTGKTSKLISILKDLLRVYEPEEIAYVSFTRKGAYEGKDRAREAFPEYHKDQFKYFRTLHSMAFMELGYERRYVITKPHYRKFSKAMGMSFTGYYTSDFYHNDDRFLFYYFLCQNNKKRAAEFLEDLDDEWTAKIVAKNYRKFKEWAGVKDFDDMMIEFIERKEPVPVKVAIIDEAQDLTTLQWEMCEVAFGKCEKIFIGGDDDQAIYEWSGADVERFLSLPGERVILDKSYRLKRNILEYSKQFSKLITNRVDKHFNPVAEGGNVIYHNSFDSLEIHPNESYYFLNRNNMYLNAYSEWLEDNGHLYTRKEKRSIPKEAVEAINVYEAVRRGKKEATYDDILLIRRWKHPEIEIGPPWYDAFNIDEDKIRYYRTVLKEKKYKEDYKLHVSTIHGVKGGEADNVVVTLDITKNVKENYDKRPDSELRCIYVACTRAKNNLHIVYSRGKNGYEKVLPM